MKRKLAIAGAIGILIAAGLLARVQAPAAHFPGPIEYVILVSVDGLMPASYTQADAHGLKVPLFRQIMREGAYSEGMQPVFPTVTYPSHTTMATGANPGTHGIFTNGAWDPLEKNEKGWRWYAEDIRVPTLWDVAHARGLRTALVWWPVSVGAHVDARVPEYWRASTPDDLKLWRALWTPGILGEMYKRNPNFCSDCKLPNPVDARIADIATTVIETERPNLMMTHLAEVDHIEHDDGPFSPGANEAIENADAQISRLIAAAKQAGLWQHTALVVASDHGFAAVTRTVRPGVLLAKHGLITLDEKNHVKDWRTVVLMSGTSAYVYVKDKNDETTRRSLLNIFEPLAGKPDSGIGRIFTHDKITAAGGDPEAFLAIEAADGFNMVGGYSGDLLSAATVKGAHGYFPDKPAMRASLLVYGPSIGNAKIENARMIDIAPTVAQWLGFRLEKAEGKALAIPVGSAAK